MAFSWQDPAPTPACDAYLDWSRLLQARRDALLPPDPDGRDWFEPVFVRLVASPLEAARRSLRDLVDDPTSPLVMDAHEYGFLVRRIGPADPFEGMADEYALYRRLGVGDEDYAALLTVLDVGSATDLDAATGPSAAEPTAVAVEAPVAGGPIVAILDDGIGFLNARFSRGDGSGPLKTRFAAIWIQSLERLRSAAAGAQRRVHVGDVLTRDDIDAWHARHPCDESAAYGAINARILGPRARRSTEYGASHGTHVLDLAAGADPDDAADPARNWPLLGVQLPPQAIEDTSGTRFESYLVQGVRWILRQAGALDPRAPVIINLSMGMLAGAKDGTRFAEYQISREAAQWERVTGQPVRVVWSFGNNREGGLVARVDIDAEAEARAPDWCVQPGDQTASYLEIRPEAPAVSTDIALSVATPCGLSSGFAPLPVGTCRSLLRDGEAVARIYHVPERPLDADHVQRSHYVIALAPTENLLAGETLAPAGAWTVALRHADGAALRVHLQIQRDDSLAGYRPGARQSYFDAQDAYDWNAEALSNDRLSDTCAIRYEGSHNALVTARARQVLSVGAARADGAPDRVVAARYSATGADWSVAGPVLGALGDDGAVLWGKLGCGTLTGSARLYDGTSAAAGRITRALALSAGRIGPATGGVQTDDLDPGRLRLVDVPPDRVARLGAVVAEAPDRRPPRRDG